MSVVLWAIPFRHANLVLCSKHLFAGPVVLVQNTRRKHIFWNIFEYVRKKTLQKPWWHVRIIEGSSYMAYLYGSLLYPVNRTQLWLSAVSGPPPAKMAPRPGILNSALTPSSCGISKAKQHHTFLFSTVTPLGPRMSNYFSNHSSQSRFLAISSSSNAAHSTSSTSSSQSPGVAQPVGGQGPTAKRARSTSKHFSTSVEAHGEGRKGEEEEDGALLPSVHPLRNTCVFLSGPKSSH
jgi:hypothetical protein